MATADELRARYRQALAEVAYHKAAVKRHREAIRMWSRTLGVVSAQCHDRGIPLTIPRAGVEAKELHGRTDS